jgi:hypothetical protein
MKENLMEVKGMSYESCLAKARACVTEGYISADELKSYANHLYQTHNNAEHDGELRLL